MKLTQKIITGIIIIIMLVGGYVLVRKHSSGTSQPANTASTTSSTSSSTSTTIGDVTITGPAGGYTVEQVPVNNGSTMPDLSRKPVTYPGAVISADVRASVEPKIIDTQAKLKKDPTSWADWVNLGTYQKADGDYAGAVLSWKYASVIASNDYVALGNLGNLYAYYIKDNAQAESYYKQAIGRSSTQAYLYVQLGEVYRDVFKDAAKARAIAEEGLSKIPNDPSLLQFKATLN
jgi:hypothetical protein